MDPIKIKTNRTFRLSLKEQDDLKEISNAYHISQNQLISQAIRRLYLKYQSEFLKSQQKDEE